MDFGLAVSDYNIEQGGYGKLLKLDISEYLPKKMIGAIGEDASKNKSTFITTENTLGELVGFLDDVNCPDIAYSLVGKTLYIFLKNDEYDTRFSFELKRNFKKMTLESSKLDIPPDMYQMFKYLVLKLANQADRSINQKIMDEENRIIALS